MEQPVIAGRQNEIAHPEESFSLRRGWIYCRLRPSQGWENLPHQGFLLRIDLIIDRKDNTINLCEIKFSTSGFVIDAAYAAELRNKIEVFRRITGTRKNVFLTMITTSGLIKNEYATELVGSEVTIEELLWKSNDALSQRCRRDPSPDAGNPPVLTARISQS